MVAESYRITEIMLMHYTVSVKYTPTTRAALNSRIHTRSLLLALKFSCATEKGRDI